MKLVTKILTVILCITFAITATAEMYPSAGIVCEVDGDLVYVETFDGEVFSFWGQDGLEERDVLALMMDDCKTEQVEDDKVAEYRWLAYIE